MKKRLISAIMASILTATIFTPTFAEYTFHDVSSNSWYYKYIENMVEKGAIIGYEDGTFRPEGTVTKGEFTKTLVSAVIGEQSPATGSDHWASPYVISAMMKGLVNRELIGNDSDLDQPISRGLMSHMVAKASDYILSEDSISNLTMAFDDLSDIKTWEDGSKSDLDYNAIAENYIRGIFTGYEDGTFKPNAYMTRGEMCAVMTRLLDKEQRVDNKKKNGFFIDGTNLSAENLEKFNTKENRILCGFLKQDGSYTAGPPATEWYNGDGNYSYKAQLSRPVTTLYENDPHRTAAIEGDTFVTKDGQSVKIEATELTIKSNTNGKDYVYRVLGLGQPYAFDLGRENNGVTIVDDINTEYASVGDKNKPWFGYEYIGDSWAALLAQTETCNTGFSNGTYYVYKLGEKATYEGHTKEVWDIIKDYYDQQEDLFNRKGTVGEYDESGYFRWNGNRWVFMPELTEWKTY